MVNAYSCWCSRLPWFIHQCSPSSNTFQLPAGKPRFVGTAHFEGIQTFVVLAWLANVSTFPVLTSIQEDERSPTLQRVNFCLFFWFEQRAYTKKTKISFKLWRPNTKTYVNNIFENIYWIVLFTIFFGLPELGLLLYHIMKGDQDKPQWYTTCKLWVAGLSPHSFRLSLILWLKHHPPAGLGGMAALPLPSCPRAALAKMWHRTIRVGLRDQFYCEESPKMLKVLHWPFTILNAPGYIQVRCLNHLIFLLSMRRRGVTSSTTT